MSEETLDVLVIGGGPAGLEAALLLSRACLSVRVLDAGRDEPGARRNAAARLAHGTIGLDGIPPAELRARASADLARHGVIVEDGCIGALARDGAHLVATREDGSTLRARRILLATGIVDVLPELPGLPETWGATVFSCPYCHGFELASRSAPPPREGLVGRWGVLAHEVAALKMAPLYTRWAREVVLFTDGAEPPAELRAAHEAGGLRYETRAVTALRHEGEALRAVVLEGNAEVPLDALVFRPKRAPSPLVEALGLALDGHGLVAVDHRNETSLKGVHACGDATTTPHQIVFAMSDGAHAAMAIASLLAFEDILR
jgi:thioredoxin reductase